MASTHPTIRIVYRRNQSLTVATNDTEIARLAGNALNLLGKAAREGLRSEKITPIPDGTLGKCAIIRNAALDVRIPVDFKINEQFLAITIQAAEARASEVRWKGIITIVIVVCLAALVAFLRCH